MKNVLLVDDDRVFNLLSTKTLRQFGFINEIHTAYNGEEALALFNKYFQGVSALPDIILLDLNMPIMDGFGFIQAFRKLNLPNKENVKIIIVSSSTDQRDIDKARELGVKYYIHKPIHKDELMSALQA